MTVTNEEAHLAALHAELAYVKAQPNVRKDRVSDIEAEITRLTPAPPEPAAQEQAEAGEVEAAVVEAPEQAVQPKARGRKAE